MDPQIVGLSLVSRPPDGPEELAVCDEFATVLRKDPQQVELDRGEMDFVARARNAMSAHVDHEVADAHGRLGSVVPRSPERGAKAGEQLVSPEGLRDVVVGADVERPNLFALVPDRGEHDDRQPAPASDLGADVDAAPVRQNEVQHDRIGRARGDRVERFLLGRRRLDLVARISQDHSEAANDLGLVVDDQNALASGAHEVAAGWGTSGNETAKEVPSPVPVCIWMRPPLASTNPRQIARPSPDPYLESLPRKKGSNTWAR